MHSSIDIERGIDHADSEYPALYQLLAGYFHEDWPEEYPSADDALRAFRAEAPPGAIRAAVLEVERLLAEQLSDGDLGRLLMEGFRLNYVPERDGRTHREWLQHVREQLGAD